jgi:hypothetical protein
MYICGTRRSSETHSQEKRGGKRQRGTGHDETKGVANRDCHLFHNGRLEVGAEALEEGAVYAGSQLQQVLVRVTRKDLAEPLNANVDVQGTCHGEKGDHPHVLCCSGWGGC